MEDIKLLFDLAKKNKWLDFSNYISSLEVIDTSIRDAGNNYLINYAIMQNQIEATRLLLEKGSSLDIVDEDGRPLTYVPVKYAYNEILELLLYYDKTSIGISLRDIRDKNGYISLHYAIIFKNHQAVKLLIESNTDEVDKKGNSSLHLAVYSKDLAICAMIMETEVNINKRTLTGETALHIACNFGLEDIIKLLVENGIDIDSQDYDHEFTALHYSINLNNNKISKYLVMKKADVNIQDYLGNTAIHYCILEHNYEMLDYILKSSQMVNLNIYNIDSKYPLHLLMEEKAYDYVSLLLEATNINFQDLNGMTVLHYLSESNLWREYKNILIKKKMDIFIKNHKNERPIDLIQKQDFEEYIALTVNSYLYILQNSNYIWSEEWENICSRYDKKKLSRMTNKDDCQDLIKKKILQIFKNESDTCQYKSYPVKKNRFCVTVEDSSKVEYCSFTGITLDILIGLIYLLNKHPDSCSTISKSFTENKPLCDYYNMIGISTKSKCEFYNFEIVWIYYKLFLSNEFIANFNKCRIRSRFIIIPLGIELRKGNHANYLIYDNKKKEIERFEPYGSNSPYKFDYNSELLDKILETKFREIDQNIKYIRPKDYLPKIGFQYFDAIESKTEKIGDPSGFCAVWSIWYVDNRLKYSDIDRKTLIKQLLNNIKQRNLAFKNLIRNYSRYVTELRDRVLRLADLSINDWINEQYDKTKFDQVISEISRMLGKFAK